ncbi:hypothetical protein SPI_03413 [Niveomyces insectorum RCEF 264]|uniref:Uncharacterized protein n=1 Tax=Niveomyces insectorum RCEF 264 TaxID=1081102 RepID=A0A162MKC7_9HYPO|nr:hypothetical protein SPI_03413 [Niveomyces insectorum RCEF 264]
MDVPTCVSATMLSWQDNRQHVEDRTRSSAEPPQNKHNTKTQSEAKFEARWNWMYPPEFWDRFSELQLTRRAVAEHNRHLRNARHNLCAGPKLTNELDSSRIRCLRTVLLDLQDAAVLSQIITYILPSSCNI